MADIDKDVEETGSDINKAIGNFNETQNDIDTTQEVSEIQHEADEMVGRLKEYTEEFEDSLLIDNSLTTLSGRMVSRLPISIGTALAIESIDGLNMNRKENARYETLWINCHTLIRNLIGSMPRDEWKTLDPRAVAIAVAEEMHQITQHLDGMVQGVRFYILGYNDLAKKFPMAKLHTPNTPKQKEYFKMIDNSSHALLEMKNRLDIKFDKGSSIDGEWTTSLILTHYPIDLLLKQHFKKLRLLESWTGFVKAPYEWYTKLTNGKNYQTIPFNKFTIQLFGDGEHHFRRYDRAVREEIVRLSELGRWTPVTKMDKIKYYVNNMKDRYLSLTLRKFF